MPDDMVVRLMWLDMYLYENRQHPRIRKLILQDYNNENTTQMTMNTLIADMERLKALGAGIEKRGREGWFSRKLAFTGNFKEFDLEARRKK